MKKFFYSHPDIVIGALALVFLGTLIAFYLWATNDIYAEVHQALVFSASSPMESFDLTDAAKLDLRGLLNTSSSSAAASAPGAMAAPVVVATTTATTTTATPAAGKSAQ